MKLFVYGTLCRGESNHHVLQGATRYCESASIYAVLYDSGCGYPAVELSESSTVIGEIYEVPDHLWPALDELEGYSGNSQTDLYNKEIVVAKMGLEEIETVVYTICDERMKKKIIPSGDWIKYRKTINR
ncbi:MAG: gamma-glutamylcyclotransferase family protein [Paenisporosarcina sp.]